MPKRIAWLLLLLVSPALAAEEVIVPAAGFAPAPPPQGIAEASKAVPSARDTTPPEPNASALALAELNAQFQQLKTAREAMQVERVSMQSLRDTSGSLSEENAKLRLKVGEILTKLANRKKNAATGSGKAPPKAGEPSSKVATNDSKSPETEPANPGQTGSTAEAARTLDPLALAHSLFQAGNFEGALKAYRRIDLKGLKAEERLPIQYMAATCLKRLDKLDDAISMYREVANSRGDEHLAFCAQWQLSALRWQRELLNQLTDARQRRQSLEKSP